MTPGATGSSSARTDQTSSPAPRPCVPRASGDATPASVSRPRCSVTECPSVLTSLTRWSAVQDREAVRLTSSGVTLASVSRLTWSVMDFTNVETDQTKPSVRIMWETRSQRDGTSLVQCLYVVGSLTYQERSDHQSIEIPYLTTSYTFPHISTLDTTSQPTITLKGTFNMYMYNCFSSLCILYSTG